GTTGSAGVAGPQGPTGSAGTTGATGAQGLAGINGATGAQGTTGALGSTGSTGTTGPTWTLATLEYNANGNIVLNGTTGSGGPITSTNAAWTILGNAGTNPSTNFLGTSDNVDLVFRTGNNDRMRIKYNLTYPVIGIGTNFPITNLIPGANSSVLHLHDMGTSTFSQFILSTHGTANGLRAGVINFAATQAVNDRRSASIESFLTASSVTNVTGDIRFFTNNNNSFTEKMRILSTGNVSINQNVPVLNDVFSVYASGAAGATNTVGIYAINGYSITTGIGIYGENTGTGTGVYGANSGASGIGVRGFSSGTTAIGIYGTNNSTGTGVYGLSTLAAGTGVVGLANGGGDGIFGSTTSASAMGLWARNSHANGTAMLAAGNNVTSFFLNSGSGIAANGKDFGVYGFAQGSTAATSAGGYFRDSLNAANMTHSWVAAYSAGTAYKVLGPGAASTIVKDLSNNNVVMFCPEAPEVLFEDYGFSEIIGGKATVHLDPLFTKNVVINQNHPLRVFIQLEGECNGVFVTNKTASSFDVVELNSGNSSVKFTYKVVANRADAYENGVLSSKFENLRFPAAPEKAQTNSYTKPFPEIPNSQLKE
ncbi:MAG TPA: hypothetical protein VFF35_06430, partial [Bacteroidia bacterium]|nr:hypothetical protein [Bacteroidia bacterium]